MHMNSLALVSSATALFKVPPADGQWVRWPASTGWNECWRLPLKAKNAVLKRKLSHMNTLVRNVSVKVEEEKSTRPGGNPHAIH